MADFRIAGPFGQYGALPKKRQQIQISESVKDVAELETRLQRAEELLKEERENRIFQRDDAWLEKGEWAAKPHQEQIDKIDAYFGGHHDDD